MPVIHHWFFFNLAIDAKTILYVMTLKWPFELHRVKGHAGLKLSLPKRCTETFGMVCLDCMKEIMSIKYISILQRKKLQLQQQHQIIKQFQLFCYSMFVMWLFLVSTATTSNREICFTVKPLSTSAARRSLMVFHRNRDVSSRRTVHWCQTSHRSMWLWFISVKMLAKLLQHNKYTRHRNDSRV